ncbi:MAG: hypothetical protein U1E71_13985 [Ramlibacter sp.]|jgi:hypothetical protein
MNSSFSKVCAGLVLVLPAIAVADYDAGKDRSLTTDPEVVAVKTAKARELISKNVIILTGKTTRGGVYELYLWPKREQFKSYIRENPCFATTFPAKFSINKYGNFVMDSKGASEELEDCKQTRIIIIPDTLGVAAWGRQSAARGGKWDTDFQFLYFKSAE